MSDSGLLHNPISGKAQQVTVTWSSAFHGTLRIEGPEGEAQEVAARDLALTRGGWRGDGLTFAWQRDGKTWALSIDDPQTISGLAPKLPAALSTQIAAWQKQGRRSSRWTATVLAISALITLLPVLALIGLFLMRDRILDIVIRNIPTHIDAEVGDRMHQQLVMSGKVVSEGPAVEAVRTAGQRFVPHLPAEDFTFRFEVINDSSVNAFAAPGGLVVVHTGLLAKATSADQLVGVLGHEISHVTRRHSLRQIIYNLGLRTTVQWALGVPDGVSVTIAGAAVNLSGLKFSRDQETDADAGGIELLQKARLPAAGLQSFFEILAQEHADVPAFLSTHPADKERMASLEALIRERGPWSAEPLAIDWDAVRQDAEARLKQVAPTPAPQGQ